MKSIKSIVIAVSSLFVLPSAVQAASFTSEQTGLAIMRLHQSVYSANSPALGGDIWLSLRQDFRLNEVNANLVRSHENRFVANRDYFNRTLVRSTPYMYHIVSEVQRRGMPAEIALLPFIESAYVTKARSNVGASGLWQFMPATGRHYGLEQTPLYDGRHDIFAATDAALNYLQYLHGLFNDWTLALAAYNWGEGNVSRAIRRAQAAGLAPTYENLNMPAETRNYVPKLLAVRNLVNNPQIFGIKLPSIKQEPYFKAVTVDTPLDIMAAAHLANISESEFLALNPAFKTPVFIPKGNRRMLLPIKAANTFEANYRESDPKTLLSWDVFTPTVRISVADLANQTGSTSADLKRLNGITGDYVNAGRTVLVNRNSMMGIGNVNSFVQADFDPTPDTFVEQAPVLTAPATQTPPVANPITKPVIIAAPKPETSTPAPTVAIDTDVSVATVAAQPETSTPAPQTDADNHSAATNNAPNASEPAANVQAALADNATATAPATTANDTDEVWAAAQAAQTQMQAAEAVRNAIARADAAEERDRVAAEARRRQQAAAEAAKPNNERTRNNTNTGTQRTHKVVRGDTVFNIAKRYNISTADLVAANQIKDNRLKLGQTLKISASKANPTSTRNNSDNKRDTSTSRNNNNRRDTDKPNAQTTRNTKGTTTTRNTRPNTAEKPAANARNTNNKNTASSRNTANKANATPAKNNNNKPRNNKPAPTNNKRR